MADPNDTPEDEPTWAADEVAPLLESISVQSVQDAAVSWTGLPVSDAEDPLLNSTLHETYIVDRVIGEGGMGRVYEARHTRVPNKRFAIKVLHAEYARNPDLRARFQREAEAAASVEHPGVVGIYDVGQTPRGGPYMVCEHLTGIDLNSYIQQAAPLPMTTVVHIGRRLCEALAAAHEHGVIHRDLKPHNVFLVGDFKEGVPPRPRIKVLDFGLSRFVDKDSQLTQTGVVMGTPGYMSPEQAQALRTDHRTDIYGVGAILYAAATGQPPFKAETPQMTVLAVMSLQPVRPRAVEPSVSEALEAVIQRAMAKEPNERFQTMNQLHQALVKLEAVPALSLMPPGPPVQVSVPPLSVEDAQSARLRLAALFLGALGFIGAGATSAIAGLLRLSGAELTFSATEIVLLGALGLAVTYPAAVLLRRFKTRIWSDTAKVVQWLPKWRLPMLLALFAYGLASLLVRFADDVMGRIAGQTLLGVHGGAGWPGWNLIFACVSLLVAVVVVVRQRWWRPRRRLKSWLFGPVLTASVTVASLSLLLWGLGWRIQHTGVALLGPEEVPPPTEKAGRVDGSRAAATESTADAPPTGKDLERAADDALAAAIAEGPDALKSLGRRYPDDPEVLRALVLAYASRANTLVDAVETAKRLLRVAPEQRQDADLRYIIGKAAQGKGKASDEAFSVLRDHMGSAGADLLYDLMLRKPAMASRAGAALIQMRKRKRFSSALAIAYDLRHAPTCKSRLPLLPRAEKLGDERSIAVLAGLTRKSSKCGKRRRALCKAQCEQEAKQFLRTIERITLRQQTAKQQP